MPFSKKLLWGGLGWVMGGPIGAILGYAFASMSENQSAQWTGSTRRGSAYSQTKSADFMVAISTPSVRKNNAPPNDFSGPTLSSMSSL